MNSFSGSDDEKGKRVGSKGLFAFYFFVNFLILPLTVSSSVGSVEVSLIMEGSAVQINQNAKSFTSSWVPEMDFTIGDTGVVVCIPLLDLRLFKELAVYNFSFRFQSTHCIDAL